MSMRQGLRPIQYLALNCTECGLPLEKHQGAAGESEINAVELIATNLHERYLYAFKTCGKCGKPSIDRHARDDFDRGDMVGFVVSDYGKKIRVVGCVGLVFPVTLRVVVTGSDDPRIKARSLRAVRRDAAAILEKFRDGP